MLALTFRGVHARCKFPSLRWRCLISFFLIREDHLYHLYNLFLYWFLYFLKLTSRKYQESEVLVWELWPDTMSPPPSAPTAL